MIKELKKRYNSPTPERWKKLGESISHLGTLLQVLVAGGTASEAVQLPGKYFVWVISISVLQWIGATIVNFAVDNKEIKNEQA